jgi:formylglycine-generating enzyme required for sulfatase activity
MSPQMVSLSSARRAARNQPFSSAGAIAFLWCGCWLCGLWLAPFATPAFAQSSQGSPSPRVALVVGNAQYPYRPLKNPVNDAELMRATLTGIGFEVIVLRNADRRTMLSGLRDFENKARSAEVALFYFAGHGAQVGGSNYLLPVGSQIQTETDVPDEAIEAASVLRRLEDARAKVALVILDACRDNPFTGASRSASRGLARMSVPTGTIVAYATAPGSTAADGAGNNGVYTQQLARHLKEPNLELRDVFDRTAQEVERLTGGKQKPHEEIGLRGRFVLVETRASGAASANASVSPQPSPSPGSSPITLLPAPGTTTGLSLDDLQKQESLRRQWADWQKQMKADYDKVVSFATSGGSAELEAKAWERFLAAWQQDNPTSQEDNSLRELAQQKMRVANLKVEEDAAGRLKREQELTTQREAAARQAEEERRRIAQAGSRPQAGQAFRDCPDCPEMVMIPAGSFMQGSPPSAADSSSDEGPQRRVSVSAFAMGKYTVTFAEWDVCVQAGGCNGYRPADVWGRGTRPVNFVSWEDAQAYVQWLSRKTGKRYTLPSESQWEYAARAGSTTAYYWGDAIGSGNANCRGCGSQWDKKQTAPVGSFRPNAFGLHDMAGNVWQWTADCWNEKYNGAPTDGSAWTSGNCERRVIRGGSWKDIPLRLRSASRSGDFTQRINDLGFRVLRTAD